MLNISSFVPKLKTLFKRQYQHIKHIEGVLGTSLELQVLADSKLTTQIAETRVLNEILRLEQVYSSFLADSELNRWQTAGHGIPSADLAWLLLEAEKWLTQSDGAFHPGIESVQMAYKNAVPNALMLEQLRLALKAPLFDWRNAEVHKLTSLNLNFNSLAKGRIADMACRAASELEGVENVLINLGGDLRHSGNQPIEVSIAHPFSSADNAIPLTQIKIQNQGVATSGHTHRGAHLYDPRTARPINQIAQVTVIAANAASADVLATIFCVLEPQRSLQFTESSQIACLLVANDGQIYTNAQFKSQMSSSILEELK